MAPRQLLLLRLRSRAEKEREREGTEWRLGARDAVPTGVSRSAERRVHNAGVRPPCGRRRVERGGRPRAGEGRGKPGRAAWLGRKGGGSAQQRLPAFLFFEFLFSKKLKWDFWGFFKSFQVLE